MVSTFLTWALANPTILAIVGGILAVFGVGFQQRRAGKQAERDKQAKARLDSMTEAQRIDEAVAGRDSATNRKELGKWSR